MKKHSAGLALYKYVNNELYILIAHMGGPFWAKKDAGAWSFPKGEVEVGEDSNNLLAVARREFKEEIGHSAPKGNTIQLGSLEQPTGKIVTIFALESDFDADSISSNTFELEWPPKSGNMQKFPEIDRAAWVTTSEAKEKLTPGQQSFIDLLVDKLQ